MLLKCFFFRLAPLKISEILPLTPFIISRLVTKITENTVKETNVPVLAKKRMATLIFFGFKKNIPSSIKNANRFREKNVISTIVPVFALNAGWNWNQGKLFRGVLSLSEKVNTRRMSQTDMESIFTKIGNFLVYDFWTPPQPPLLSILYMGVTGSFLT